jgi:uncharacterized integral membrane protein (TIGR00697 family)
MYNEIIFLIQFFIPLLILYYSTRLPYELLVMIVTVLLITANIVVNKQILCFSCLTTPSEGAAIGVGTLITLIQYRFGHTKTHQTLIISALGNLLFFTMLISSVAYLPATNDTFHAPLTTITLLFGRTLIASLLAYTTSQILATRLRQQIIFSQTRYTTSLLTGSTILAMLLDTTAFTTINFIGTYPLATIIQIGLFALATRCITLIFYAPFIAWFIQKNKD